MQQQNVRVSRDLPQPNVDENSTVARAGRYGELITIPLHGKKHFLADEGSYFIIPTATPGSPVIISAAITSFDESAGATGAALFIKNNAAKTASFPKRIYLDYIKLLTAVVPLNATSWQYALVLDDNPVRYGSGGTQLYATSPNGDCGAEMASLVTCYFGALTTAVPNNRRTVGRGALRGVIPTVFDELVICSGSIEGGGGMGSAAGSGRSVSMCPPIIVGPQQNLVLTMWGAAYSTAAQFEVEIGGWIR